MIFTKNKEGVQAIRAMKYKKCNWNIYSRTRTFGEEVHRSNIRVKRWHNKYENSELYWKTQLLLKWFTYQVQSYWNTDLWCRGTNFWDTLYILCTMITGHSIDYYHRKGLPVWAVQVVSLVVPHTLVCKDLFVFHYPCSLFAPLLCA